MRVFALVAFLALPAVAYTPEELLTARQVGIKCDAGVCTVSQADMEWIVGRDRLLSQLVDRLYEKAQSCNGGRTT